MSTPPPFSALVAVDLTSGTVKWKAPLGSFAGTLSAAAAARLTTR